MRDNIANNSEGLLVEENGKLIQLLEAIGNQIDRYTTNLIALNTQVKILIEEYKNDRTRPFDTVSKTENRRFNERT